MSILEKRLDRLDPDWQGKLYLVDWDEVDAWAKAQEEEERRAVIEPKEPDTKGQSNSKNQPNPKYMSFDINQLNKIGWEFADNSIIAGLNDAIIRLNLNTPKKVLFFLATITHESDGGKKLKQSGSTWKYRGSGYIQITGEKRYKAFAQYMNDPRILNIGADYVAKEYPWESAIWYWGIHRDINKIIDGGADFEKVTEYIRKMGEPLSDKRKQAYENIKNTLFASYDIDE
ncbi:MAG TPA: hypothetical protein VM577_20575 [Anaerovoracaceae bacterium]|nr:hypothetical protein [Anaerovoracaceae bacterium]